MKIYRGVEEFSPLKQAIVTEGTFDGVHFGHLQILQKVKEIAHAQNGETVLITYWPHPRFVLGKNHHDLKLLNTLNEKIERLSAFGIDHLLILEFTQQFASFSKEEYVNSILVEGVGTKTMVIGYDHRFGKNREGDFAYLKENSARFGFAVHEIPQQQIDAVAVSSTKIRKALHQGKIEEANQYLMYPYQLTGIVVKGEQIGRTIGYPTANLQVLKPYKLIPTNGIYVVEVLHNNTVYGGMLNIGVRPTIAENLHKTVEVNIFDFREDIYGEEITLKLIHFVRPEEKFKGLRELKEKIDQDEKVSRAFLSHYKKG